MTTHKIVIIDGGYRSYSYEKKLFTKHGYELVVFNGENNDWDGKLEFSRDAVGILVRWTEINDMFLSKSPNLRAVVRYGVGYENIDLAAASRRGVRVANIPGCASHSVSDHALALMYACCRALFPARDQFHSDFGRPPRRQIFEFHNKTLGIIGFGHIGSTLCRKARHLFKQVLAVDPYVDVDVIRGFNAVKTDLSTLFTLSDVISLHCNLTDETRYLINRSAFDTMRRRPILINTSRGDVIDESALLYALENRRIHSAGLDVFHEEPPAAPFNLIRNHPNVITTGHYAWYSETAIRELQKRAANNMILLLQGEIPEDCLNPTSKKVQGSIPLRRDRTLNVE